MTNKLAMSVLLVVVTLSLLIWVWMSRPWAGPVWTIDGVRFDTSGWHLQEASATTMSWTNAEGDALSLARFEGEAVSSAEDLSSLRVRARQSAESNRGGIVQADFVHAGGTRAASLIFKKERLPAYAYTGMFIVPGDGHHFVVTVDSVERGVTGMRDAIVTAQLIEQGKLDLTKTGTNHRLEGWFSDPYDSQYNATALNSLADGEQYDSLVRSHPLSKVRQTLRTVGNTLTLQQL